MAAASTWSGGCLCGAVRFEATGVPGNPHTCSCDMCRRHTGGLTAAWVEFAKDDVRWTGPGGAPALYRSSAGSSRAFCSACGSSLGAVDDAPVIALLVGTFDNPSAVELVPTAHSFEDDRPAWWRVRIAGEP